MLSHQAIVANICQSIGTDIWHEDDVLLNALPLYHLAGLGAFAHIGFAAGSTTVLLPRFDLEQVLHCVEQYRVTQTVWVPPILLAMTKDPRVDNYDLSSLTCVVSGAAPVGRELGELFTERFRCKLCEVYGMTEASPVTHLTPPDRIIHGSTGPLIPNTEGKIVDTATGDELGYNEQGEIWVRGPQVMKGYLNRPDATAITITPDGWLRTGDIGYADEDGYFYIVDRLKELIKYKALPGCASRTRRRPQRSSRDPRRRRHRQPGRSSRRAAEGVHRHRERPERAGDHRLRRRAGRTLQEDPPGRVHRRHPEESVREDPPPRADRARTRGRRRLRGSN